MNWYLNTGQRSEKTSNRLMEVELSKQDMGIGKVSGRMYRYYQECRNGDACLNLIDSETPKREQ